MCILLVWKFFNGMIPIPRQQETMDPEDKQQILINMVLVITKQRAWRKADF